MTWKYSTTVKNARLDAVTTGVGTSGLIRIYSGTRPATVDTAPSGGNTLLVQCTCSSTFAAAASGGVLTLNTISNGTASNTVTAVWGRVTKSDGTAVADGDVGTEFTLSPTTSVTSGQVVAVTAMSITHN